MQCSICVHLCLSVASVGCYQRDAALVFVRADFAGDRPADFLEAGEVPEVGKIAALLRLDRLDSAIDSFQKNASAIRFFLQGQPAPVPAQPGELLDELVFAAPFERSQPGDFGVRQPHLSRPAAAGRATLTLQKSRHGQKLSSPADFKKYSKGGMNHGMNTHSLNLV